MNFADSDTGRIKGGQRLARLFKFDRKMTTIVIHAQKVIQAWIVSIFISHLRKEGNRLGGIFQDAKRFGFEPQVQFFSGLLGHARNVFDATPEILADGFFLRVRSNELLKPAGKRAHASRHIVRHEPGQEIEEQVGVVQAIGRGPVRQINLFLHRRAVKCAVGKTVNGENVTGVFFEPALKFQEGLAVGQFGGGAAAQPQSDGEPPVWADPAADGQGVLLQRIEGFRPILAMMNIRAIGKMRAMV